MKKKIYFKLVGFLALIVLISCDPFMDENPDAGLVLPPDASEMDFSITPGNDSYHFKVELLSPVLSGINTVSFDLGNGSVVKEKSAVGYYPLPDTYTITMTIITNGGSTSITKVHTTTATDYSIFTDEKFVALTGGVDNLAGKTWMVDAATQGHFGVGSTGSDGLEWWSAAPYVKEGTGAYDDELTFNINGFAVTYENMGVSYVKGYMKDDPNLSAVYLNPRLNKDDWDVDYTTPVVGNWAISEKDDGFYIQIIGNKRIFPGLDVGALNNEYKIVNISENELELTCFSAYEDWTKWHYILIPKGYERPSIEWGYSLAEGTGVNSFEVTLNVTNIPAGQSIEKFKVDFGNGNTFETTDVNELISDTYMRAGTYTITITAFTSLGELVETTSAVVANHHPDYEEFILNEIVMYADFSEVMMAPVNGEDCFVAVAENPDRTYPNKSANVAFYSKSNQQWANANMQLPSGYRFDLRNKQVVKLKVFGKAGQEVLLKFENTDRGGNAWQTGAELKYTIQQDDTWENAEFDFNGVGAGWDWTGDQFTSNIATDERFNNGFYNIIRIMLNPGVGEGTHEFYFDELAGPHVEGIKSGQIK